MRYSQLFGKTIKEAPKDATSTNAKFLTQASFIDQLMSGSFTLMPLGLRIISKIEGIVREEMNKTGGQEVLMPLLHPKAIWNETGRWDSAREVMYQFKKDEREYALSFTHEEIVLDLVRKHISSHRDLPVKIYHFSTKFRDELRAKSGILRGREFLMKDLYSIHDSKEDLDKYYFEVAESYLKIFKKIGLDAKVVEAAGGVFTKDNTHEFQVLSESGEDVIFYCDFCDFAQNQEIVKVSEGDKCPQCKKGKILSGKSIEVGNIFRFGTVYSEKMKVYFTNKNGEKKPVWFGSYGIGITRLMGTLVEVFNDDKGVIWPKAVSPFDVHLVSLDNRGEQVYKELLAKGVDVLWDDREEVSAGEKFADCDLIGIPTRLVISQKVEKGKIEWKDRAESKTETMLLADAIKRLKVNLS